MSPQATETDAREATEQDNTERNARVRMVAGLRDLADFLEAHPDVPRPHGLPGRHLGGEEFKQALATGAFGDPTGHGDAYLHARALDCPSYDVQCVRSEYEDACRSDFNMAAFWAAKGRLTRSPTDAELRDMALRYALTDDQINSVMAQLDRVGAA